jgi:PE-PPE domain
MIDRLSRIGGATIIGLGLVAAVNVSAPAIAPVSYTADLQLTTKVLALGGLGFESVDPELIAGVLGGRYADVTCDDGPGKCLQGLDWPGKVTPLQGSIDVGLANMDKAILDQYAAHPDEQIIVAGASAGTLVVNQEMQSLEQRRLAGDPTVPPPSQLSFVVLGDADRSMFRKLQGVPLPLITYTVHPVPVTEYNVLVVAGEYDGLGDWPDRTWNLLADLNALAGTSLLQQALPEQIVTALKLDAFGSVHRTAMDADLTNLPFTTSTNAAGGITTTYLVPTPDLPLLRPLKPLGVPQPVIDALTAVLRPIIDSAYFRNDPVNPKPAPGHTTTTPVTVAAQSAAAKKQPAVGPSASASARPARAAKAAKAAAKPAGSVRRAARASAAN